MPPLTAVGAYRIRKGDTLQVVAINSTAGVLTVRFRVLYDDGDDDDMFIDPITGSADRTVQSVVGRDRAKKNGWIVAGVVSVGAVATKRGQFYVVVSTTDGSAFTVLCRGYVYDGKGLALGEFTEPGPEGGQGFRSWFAVGQNIAGNSISQLGALANAYLRVHGLVVYFNADGNAATRLPVITLEDPGLILPTGFVMAAAVWIDGNALSLTLSQEGIIYVSRDRSSKNTNGTLAVLNTTTAPAPLPYDIEESDLANFTVAVGAGLAGDVYSFYADIEEWLVI